jgi:predicted MFS family arabinose efflux permease
MPPMPVSLQQRTENDPRYEGWRVAAASAVGVFFASILVYSFAVLLGPISRELGWSRQAVSTAYSLMAITSAACAPALGAVIDRRGPRRVAVPCVVLCGVGVASLVALTPARVHMYSLFAVMGIAGVGTSALAYSRAVSTWFEARRGLALSMVISGGAVASMTHPPATEVLIRAVGWRHACLVLGVVVLSVGVPIVATFVRERELARSTISSEVPGAPARAALKSWIIWVLLLVIGTASVAINSIIVHLPSLLTDRGITPQRAALTLSAMGMASVSGRLLTGWLLDRFRGTRVSFVLLLIAAAGIALLARSRALETSVSAVVMIGFGLGGELDVTPFLLSRYFGVRAVSTLYGFAWTAMGIAGAAGPFLMGRAFDRTGSYDGLLLWLALSTLAAGALMLILPTYTLRTQVQPGGAAAAG